MEDPGERAGEEPVRAVVEAELGPHEQQLGERARVERERDLVRDGLGPRASGPPPEPAAGTKADGWPGRAIDPLGQGEPGGRLGVPGQPQGGEAGARLRGRRGLELRRGQDVGERD